MGEVRQVGNTHFEYNKLVNLDGSIPHILLNGGQVFVNVLNNNFRRFTRQDLFKNISVRLL